MATGQTPFDMDPRHKQARIRYNAAYQVIVGIVVLLVTAFVLYALAAYHQARVVVGPLLQVQANGALLAAWRTGGQEDTRLLLNAAQTPQGQGTHVQVVDPQVADGYFVAPLPPLLPDYRVATYSILTDIRLFRRQTGPWTIALPPADAPFRFAVFGRNAGQPRPESMATGILQTQPHLVLHIGDLLGQAGQRRLEAVHLYDRQVLQPYAILLNFIPFMPVVGAQEAGLDAGRAFRQSFVLPANGPEGMPAGLSYWFDYGTARFVAIDGSLPAEAMRRKVVPWLQKVLAERTTTWRFALLEPSAYTGGPGDPPDETVRQVLVPAFEAGRVDVVFSAGGRLYERTHPLRGGQPAPAGGGIVYITTGAGGQPLQAEQRPPPEYLAAYNDQVHSFTVVDLMDGRMRIRQVGEYGQLVDDWRYSKPVSAE